MRLLPFLLLFPFFLSAQNKVEDSLFIANNYSKREVMIEMRDGARLFTAIYEMKYPKGMKPTPKPILINRTPYSCSPYGEANYRAFYETYWMKYLQEGYTIVLQDVRGRYMSEGEFLDVRPFNPKKNDKEIDEASDTYDTVDWLVKNTVNNGNVGVFGISYPGFYSSMAALSGHPAIKAVSPQAPVTDWFIGDDFHHNGAFMLMDAFSFYSGFGKPRPAPTTERSQGYNFQEQDGYNFFLKMGAVKNSLKPEYLGTNIKFWNDMLAHPNYDEWWKARNIRPHLTGIKPAMLTVGGLFDAEDCWGAWETYKSIENQNTKTTTNKVVFGPWVHGGWSRMDGDMLGNVKFGSKTSKYYQDSIEFPFFQKYLNGVKNTPELAEATVFFTGENTWKKLDTWQPKNTVQKNIYLQPKGKLSFKKPKQKNQKSSYISDPNKPVPYTEDVHLRRTREYMTDDQRFAARRPDVLVFETEILADDITLAGSIIADLSVQLSTTDADFVVKIIDVFPDDFTYPAEFGKAFSNVPTQGYQMLVRGEVMRGKFRNSLSNPEPFKPNTITAVQFKLPDVAHTFKKGHKLMVQIQSSWFPLVDRNPQQFKDIYQCSDDDFIKSEITVWHDAEYPSSIILPIVNK